MQNASGYGKVLSVRDGYLVCPVCRINRKVMRVLPTTTAQDLQVYCKSCKTEILIDIVEGKCYQSQGRQSR